METDEVGNKIQLSDDKVLGPSSWAKAELSGIQIYAFDIMSIHLIEGHFKSFDVLTDKALEELILAVNEMIKINKNEFRQMKMGVIIGPVKYTTSTSHEMVKFSVAFLSIATSEILVKLPNRDIINMVISCIYNKSTARLSMYGPAIATRKSMRATFMQIIMPIVTRLNTNTLTIPYVIDGDDQQFFPKSPTQISARNLIEIEAKYAVCIPTMKYDGTRIIAICSYDDNMVPVIRCYSRHAQQIKDVDSRIENACFAIQIQGDMPFILEMEAYGEDYNSSKSSALVGKGQMSKLSLKVFNYIALRQPDIPYERRFAMLGAINDANIEGISRVDCFDDLSFDQFMKKSREMTETMSHIEGAVLWHRNEMFSSRGDLFKVKYSYTDELYVDGIEPHKDGVGINLLCHGIVNGIEINSSVPLRGSKEKKRILINAYLKDPQRAFTHIGNRIKVIHFGIDVQRLRHPHADM